MTSISTEKWTAIAGIAATATVILKKLFSRKGATSPPPKPDYVTHAEFQQGLNSVHDALAAGFVALAKKIDSNHHEIANSLDRQVSRINALETGLARVDERTK